MGHCVVMNLVRTEGFGWLTGMCVGGMDDIAREDHYPLPHIQDLNANLAG